MAGEGARGEVRVCGAESLVLAIAISLKSAVLLSDAKYFGRLALPPLYDDVAYFNDALTRVNQFKANGMGSVVRGLASSPPHSPYSTVAAFVGFLISGNSQAAPYAMNGVAIFFLTVAWFALFRVRRTTAALSSIVIVSSAWFDNVVTIFQPDLIAGYGAAIIAAALVFQSSVFVSTRRILFVGAIAGLVLMIKPTAFSPVLALWGVALLLGSIASRLDGHTTLETFRKLLIALGALIAVAAPYFVINSATLIREIYQNFVVNVDAWKIVYLKFYGQDDQYGFFIRQTAALFTGWFELGAVLFLIACGTAGRNRSVLMSLLGLLACLVVAYIIPTMTPVRVMLFGMFIYGMIMIIMLTSLHLVQLQIDNGRRDRTLGRYFGFAYCLLIVGVPVLALVEMQDAQGRFPPYYLQNIPFQYDRVYAALMDAVPYPSNAVVLFPTAGPVPPSSYRFRSLLNDGRIEVKIAPLEADSDNLLSMARAAKVTVVPDEMLLQKVAYYPVNALLAGLVSSLRSDAAFEERPPVGFPDGQMLIFRRR
jgi:hypothetical protein